MLLAVACGQMARSRIASECWPWLTLFGLTSAVRHLMVLLAGNLGGTRPIAMVHLTCVIAALAFLLEFGRRCWNTSSPHRIAPWIHVAWVLVAVWTLRQDIDGAAVVLRAAVALPASLLASAALWRLRRNVEGCSVALAVGAVAMAAFAICVCAATPHGELFASQYLATVTGLGVADEIPRAFRSACVFVLSAALWCQYAQTARPEHRDVGPGPYVRYAVHVLVLITATFAAGYAITEHMTQQADRQCRADLIGDARATAASVTSDDLAYLRSPDPHEVRMAAPHIAGRLYRMCAMGDQHASTRLYVSLGDEPVELFSSDQAEGGAPGRTHLAMDPALAAGLRRAMAEDRATVVRSAADPHRLTAVASVTTDDDQPTGVALAYTVNDTAFRQSAATERVAPILITLLFAGLVLAFRGAQLRSEEGRLAVAAREARFRGYFEMQGVGLAAVSADGRCMDANPYIAALLGYSRTELAAMRIADVMHADDVSAAEASLRAVIAGAKRKIRLEMRLIRADGEVVFVEVAGSEVRNGEGRIDHVLLVVHDIGDRLRREEALQQLSLAVEQNPASILVTDVNGVIEYVNPKYLALTGYTREECIGRTADMVWSDRMAPEVHEEVRHAIAGGHEWYGALLNCKKSGDLMWEHVSISPLKASDGRVTHFVAVKEDITDRVEAQNALRESQQRLSLVIEQSPMGVIEWDTSARVRTWNAAAERIFGYTAEEAVGRDCYELMVAPDLRVRAHALWQRVLADAHVEPYTAPGRTKAGCAIVCEWRTAALCDSDGKPFGAVSLVADVTERVRVENSLHESEERFRAMATASLDAIIMMDPDGRISFWNSTAELMFGYPAHEAVGRDLHTVIAAPHLQEAANRALRAFESNAKPLASGRALETVARRSDGYEFPVEVQVSQVQLNSQWNALGTVRDITFRKRAEEEILQARDAAEAASRAKSDFLASMSHEIRTPMNGVIGMSELLLGTQLDDEQRDYAATIRASGDALLGIINDILDFSKIEAGKLTIDEADINLPQILEGAAELASVSARGRDVEYVCDIAPDLQPSLRGDAGRIRQIVTNLLGNATKFTDHGGIVLRAEVTAQTDAEQDVRITVIDTGIGIPADKQALIFDSFTQVDPSATRRHGGTGLGLAICRRLANLMGGTITVKSEPGIGSEFRFDLPLRRSAASATAPPEQPHLAGVHAIIVDDSPACRRALRSRLEAWGAACDEAPDMPTALDVLRRPTPRVTRSVILLDAALPDADPEALRRAAVAAGGTAPPVIALVTAAGPCPDGCAAGVGRPVRIEPLARALHTVLMRSGPAGSAPGPGARMASDRSIAGTRVLVAEDNPVNRKVAVRILERLGCHVETADNGADAARLAVPERCDVVLMDCHMPEVDGYEATRRIRAGETGTGVRIPIIALTASAMSSDRERCLECGMDAFVTKPFRSNDLVDVIARFRAVADPPEAPQESRPAHAGTLDEEQLAASCQGDDSFEREVVDEFAHTLSVREPVLRQAVGAGDVGAACLCAHALKGASLTIGAPALAELFLKIESDARRGETAAATGLLGQIPVEWERYRQAFAARSRERAA